MCACEDDDAYCCWASRYNLGMPTIQEVRDDGGPCECSCHNEYDDDADDV